MCEELVKNEKRKRDKTRPYNLQDSMDESELGREKHGRETLTLLC